MKPLMTRPPQESEGETDFHRHQAHYERLPPRPGKKKQLAVLSVSLKTASDINLPFLIKNQTKT